MKVNHVSVVGGTHGNEYTGVYLVKEFMLNLGGSYNFELSTIIANPEAHSENKRFIDEDLNRAFSNQLLGTKNERGTVEAMASSRLINELGEKSETPCDFLIDLHTTTSYMGPTIVVSKRDPLTLACVEYIQENFSEVKIIEDYALDDDSYLVNKIAPKGFLVEVGPVAQGLLSASVFESTKLIVMMALEFLHEANESQKEFDAQMITYPHYKVRGPLFLPQDRDGKVIGMVHPELEGADFTYVQKGSPLFLLFDGNVIESEDDFYPIFINEAAYFPEKIALVKTDLRNKGA